MSDNNWFIYQGQALQATKETSRRLYFKSSSRWRDTEFFAKGRVPFRDLSEETARAIAAAHAVENEANAEARSLANDAYRLNAAERKAKVDLILGRTS